MVQYSMNNKKKKKTFFYESNFTSICYIYVLKYIIVTIILHSYYIKKSHADINEESQSVLYKFHTVLLSLFMTFFHTSESKLGP
jgi:hypothetical protein